MPEKPRLFNQAMMEALLAGRKTQTRDPANWLRGFGKISDLTRTEHGSWEFRDEHGILLTSHEKALRALRLRYQVGDVMWCRETWAHCQPVLNIRKQDGRAITEISDGYAEYKADGFDTIQDLKDHRRLVDGHEIMVDGDKWRPNIHMPRWAARLFLQVTDVKLERIQNISEEDAKAEGIYCGTNGHYADYPSGQTCPGWASPRESFRTLWDSIYAKRGLGWNDNPVVAVYTFKVVTDYQKS